MNVILAIRCVEHFWGIIRVFLLSDAHVDSDMGLARGVVLKGDVKLSIFSYFLTKGMNG